MSAELEPADTLHLLVSIALYSGMRREEIAQITGKDFEEIEGTLCFMIRRGKTARAVRSVPVHPELLPLVQDQIGKPGYLLQGLNGTGKDKRRGITIGGEFSKLKTGWGFGSELTFHGFRKCFATKLEAAQVPVSTAEALLGHSRSSMSFGTYSRGPGLAALRAAVAAVRYPI